MPANAAVPSEPADPTDVELLVEIEHEGWQALCTGGDAGADLFAGLMAPGAVMVMADGSILGRDDVVSALRDATPWDTYTIEEPSVVPISADVHAVVYVATGRRGDVAFRGVLTSTYVNTSDGWLLAFHQQTSALSREARGG
jgi:Domain of unknown function (DUF4440)